MLLLPSNKITFKTRLSENPFKLAVESEFLRNYFFQKYIIMLELIPKISFGMLPEDSHEVAYYNVGVEK